MRISIDCRYVRERPSGIGNYVSSILAHLPGLGPSEQFHLWVDPRASRPLSRASNVEETVVAAAANGVRTLAAPAHLVDLTGVDVLHAPFNTMGRGLDCPTVVTVHDLMWLEQPHWCVRSPWLPFKYAYYRNGIRRALQKAAQLIAISGATADRIRPHIDRPERLRVIHHGVSSDFTPGPVHPDLRRRLGLPPRFFLVVGQDAPYKNQRAIRAAFEAASLPRDVGLVMVQRLHGRRPRKPDSRVVWLPSVHRDELIALYRSALAFVQFSRCEGFGLPALEAAACGAPVIASRIPAAVEILADAALFVPLRRRRLCRALERIATDDGLRREHRARGIERARAFGWRACADRHLQVYRAAAQLGS